MFASKRKLLVRESFAVFFIAGPRAARKSTYRASDRIAAAVPRPARQGVRRRRPAFIPPRPRSCRGGPLPRNGHGVTHSLPPWASRGRREGWSAARPPATSATPPPLRPSPPATRRAANRRHARRILRHRPPKSADLRAFPRYVRPLSRVLLRQSRAIEARALVYCS